ncbi:class II aldolase/adducin family protein [Cryobacterium serini]|uniref:Class II aldolase/adducin N-terminal domain-containing protein n=1 Tax=Cryobacterium serini TaxID=1259201 RepID=A0A4R9BIR9_9MICO|nr:class II aldolase/adducin family protein [Cryobacterium serini]TFD85206.1 hypothetical protein E3T51_15285 [Cryobacterium serini]
MQRWTDERRTIAEGCRILAHRGLVDDILGHISFRVDETTVLVRCRGPLERGLAFTLPADIHELSLDGSHDLPDLAGHGLTAAGESVEQAVIRAVNVETLAKMQLSVLSAGATPPDIVEADRGDLPDLGSAFNDAMVWRFHLAAIDHAGLSIRRPEEAK